MPEDILAPTPDQQSNLLDTTLLDYKAKANED